MTCKKAKRLWRDECTTLVGVVDADGHVRLVRKRKQNKPSFKQWMRATYKLVPSIAVSPKVARILGGA